MAVVTMVSRQSCSQPPLSVAQASKSSQLTPSPVKPRSQVQEKDPRVFSQVALAWQSEVPALHSSMSVQERPLPS